MPDGNCTPNLEPRVAVLEQIAVDMQRRFDAFERHFDARFDSLERRMGALERRQHTDFIALLTVMLGGYAGMLGVMAHGFHWI